jgi:hypothetical protein
MGPTNIAEAPPKKSGILVTGYFTVFKDAIPLAKLFFQFDNFL